MLDPWQFMASNGRSVAELTRAELEDLLMEMTEELDIRKQTAHELLMSVTQLQTRVQVVESSVQDANTKYLKPPKAMKPRTPYKVLKATTTIPGDDSPRKDAFKTQVTGSFNPYEAGSRRVTALQHRLGDVHQQILDCKAETEKLMREKAKLQMALESREVPRKEIFKHEKPIPKHCPKEGSVDARKCMTILEHLIDNEKDRDERDVLLCCHMLLTGHDKKALQLFSALYDPDSHPDEEATLQEALIDREVQVTIVLEQFKNLAARHQSLMKSYVDLKQRLEGHLIDKEDVIFSLKHQIAELQEKIDAIPEVNAEIEKLKEQRDQTKAKVSETARKSRESVSFEVGLKNQEADIKREIAGQKALLGQLEKQNQELKSEFDVRTSKTTILSDEIEEMQTKYAEMKGQDDVIQEKTGLLRRARIRTAEQVKEIYEQAQRTSAEELHNTRTALNNETTRIYKEMKNLKHICKELNITLQDKGMEIQSLKDRIKKINEAMAGAKKVDMDARREGIEIGGKTKMKGKKSKDRRPVDEVQEETQKPAQDEEVSSSLGEKWPSEKESSKDEGNGSSKGRRDSESKEEKLSSSKEKQDSERMSSSKGRRESESKEEKMSSSKGRKESSASLKEEKMPSSKGRRESESKEEKLSSSKGKQESEKEQKLSSSKGAKESEASFKEEKLSSSKGRKESSSSGKEEKMSSSKGDHKSESKEERMSSSKGRKESSASLKEEKLSSSKGRKESESKEEKFSSSKGKQESEKEQKLSSSKGRKESSASFKEEKLSSSKGRKESESKEEQMSSSKERQNPSAKEPESLSTKEPDDSNVVEVNDSGVEDIQASSTKPEDSKEPDTKAETSSPKESEGSSGSFDVF